MEPVYSKRTPESIVRVNQNKTKKQDYISRSSFCRQERNIVFEREKNSGHRLADEELLTVKMKTILNLGEVLSRCSKRAEQRDAVGSRPASYNLIRSPEFKPGNFFVLPNPTTNYNYQNQKPDKFFMSCTYGNPQTSTQLCNSNSRRKIFCEVLGDKVCLDCNGRNMRQAFNAKMDFTSTYPQLQYASNERPYGYFPRTIRLTEPLKTRNQLEVCFPSVRHVSSAPHVVNFKKASTLLRSESKNENKKLINANGIKIFIQTRPCTI